MSIFLTEEAIKNICVRVLNYHNDVEEKFTLLDYVIVMDSEEQVHT